MFGRGKRSVPGPRPSSGIDLEMKDHRRLPEGQRAFLSDKPLEPVREPCPRLACGDANISTDRQRRLNRAGLSHPDLIDGRAFRCVQSPRPMRGGASFAARGHTRHVVLY
jgi:hypothetical protein